MYVDQNNNNTLGDYVAAGPLKLTKKGSVWNCFARKSGALTQGGTCANEIKAGENITLKSKVIQMVMHVHLVMKKLLQVVLILN